ncbi:glyoxal oxidase N-terminus-domain-containing protein [Globomyces pollinis-pini]|nr:glyoxal oxidase N-terminus-domain-containing protein [Globomyces pollinis-pini]KAJ3000777.1 hypothetical protein HDV02_003579 [Globomyces sp. JEL0801]
MKSIYLLSIRQVLAIGLGYWDDAGSSGVTCIHTALLPNSQLLCFERPHLGPIVNGESIYPINPLTNGVLSTQIDLLAKVNSDGKWTSKFTPIPVLSNPFCAGHAQMANGSILVAGGDNQTMPDVGSGLIYNGRKGVRIFNPCPIGKGSDCIGSWVDVKSMSSERWYPTVVTLADGTNIIIGGQTKNIDFDHLAPTDDNPTYEYYPPKSGTWPKRLDLLSWAFPHNLYAPSFQLPTGGVFIHASNRSIILDTKTEKISFLPDMPELEDHSPWIYPHTPFVIPLPMTKKNKFKFELLFCGGSKLKSNGSSSVCMTFEPGSSNPTWKFTDSLLYSRVMPDAVLLPDGTIFATNGAGFGQAGGNQGQVQYASDPVFESEIYNPEAATGSKWKAVASAKQMRLYHSGAVLVETGHVVTMGSEMDNYNDYWPKIKPNCFPEKDAACTQPFNTKLERFTPPYLESVEAKDRPVITNAPLTTTHGSLIAIDVDSTAKAERVTFTRICTVTHSTSTDPRFVELIVEYQTDKTLYIRIPDNPALAIPGNWFVWVLNKDGIPSVAKTIALQLGDKKEVSVPAGATKKSDGFESLPQIGWVTALLAFAVQFVW